MSRSEVSELVSRVEARRRKLSAQLDPQARAQLGQIFTPAEVADFIAALPSLPETGSVRLLDPGAGVSSLTASVVARAARESLPLTVHVTAFEVDERLYSLKLSSYSAEPREEPNPLLQEPT
jgi:adenine-specific DNA-methyltransferase